jgi:hypothetical protein
MKPRSRRAFTRFELLAVLAVLALVVGLLLPAGYKAQMTAARTQSMNNLKQIGLAVHSYHDTFRVLPPGNDANNFSAAAHLLPFLDQDGVYRSIDLKKPVDDKANADARRTPIKVFLSPLDRVQSVRPDYGATNYLFNAGSKPALEDNDGLFFEDSRVRLVDITDGLSNTLLAGETLKGYAAAPPGDVRRHHIRLGAGDLKGLRDDSGVEDLRAGRHVASDRCASWMDGRFLQGTFTGTRAPNDPRPDVDCGGRGGLSALRGRQAGSNVLLGDGSVRAVDVDIKVEVWKALTTRNGGEAVRPDDF